MARFNSAISPSRPLTFSISCESRVSIFFIDSRQSSIAFTFGARVSLTSVQQILANGQIELTGRLETGMTRHFHYIVFSQAIGEPIAQARTTEVVELTVFNSRPVQNRPELPREIVERTDSLPRSPSTTFAQLLDAVVAEWSHKDVWVPFGLFRFVPEQGCHNFIGLRYSAVIGIFDGPLPRLSSLLLRRHFSKPLFETNVMPNDVEQPTSSQTCAQRCGYKQIPSDRTADLVPPSGFYQASTFVVTVVCTARLGSWVHGLL
jgi:hypothetical protein